MMKMEVIDKGDHLIMKLLTNLLRKPGYFQSNI